MASKGWKVVQVHVPMIKFRKGGHAAAGAQAASAPSQIGQTSSAKPAGATGPNVVLLPTIDDLQLPPRFQRKLLDQKEIDFINRGGPE